MTSCAHTATRMRTQDGGIWCVECGDKVYDFETRECQHCMNYDERVNSGAYCLTKDSFVFRTMQAVYKIQDGTCFRERRIYGDCGWVNQTGT